MNESQYNYSIRCPDTLHVGRVRDLSSLVSSASLVHCQITGLSSWLPELTVDRAQL